MIMFNQLQLEKNIFNDYYKYNFLLVSVRLNLHVNRAIKQYQIKSKISFQ